MSKFSLLVLVLLVASATAYMRKKTNATIAKNYSGSTGGTMAANSNGNGGAHVLPTGLQNVGNVGTSTEKVAISHGTSKLQGKPNNCTCTDSLPADSAPTTGGTGKNCTCSESESLPSDFMSLKKNSEKTEIEAGNTNRVLKN